MPKILHEQTGLRIWQNARNGFTVCRLHFTADPRKRSDEWIAASKRGMSTAQWQQEFDINYEAHQGERAFPEIVNRRGEIVFREGPYVDNEFPKDLHMWGGFDYGAKNPSSFHVYTVVDGITWCIWEMYEPCRNLIDFAARMKLCPYWNQIRYIVHDPDMGNMKQRGMDGNVSNVLAQFVSQGITRWVEGATDESAWLSTMARHWCGQEITFKILETCPNMVDEFTHATYISMTDRQLESQNYREALVDRHNHALDDCKYFMNSGISRERRAGARKSVSLVAAYGWGSPGTGHSGRYAELGI